MPRRRSPVFLAAPGFRDGAATAHRVRFRAPAPRECSTRTPFPTGRSPPANGKSSPAGAIPTRSGWPTVDWKVQGGITGRSTGAARRAFPLPEARIAGGPGGACQFFRSRSVLALGRKRLPARRGESFAASAIPTSAISSTVRRVVPDAGESLGTCGSGPEASSRLPWFLRRWRGSEYNGKFFLA